MKETANHNNPFMQEEEKEFRILELWERRHELTDDELKELAASEDMQDALLDMMDMGEAVAAANARQERERIQKRKTAYRRLAYAAAACILALLVFAVWNSVSTDANEGVILAEKTNGLPKNMVFQKQDNSRGVTLTSASGNSITPALQSVGTSVVADFTVLKNVEAQEVKMDVPVGYDATVTLPDGSVAYMHPGSRLKFPTKFTGECRQVILEGECYFKVTHDEEHPFVVEANDVFTTVLGTEFNVSTNSNGSAVVTLVNGSVRVNDMNSDAEMRIVPGQQVTLRSNRFVAKSVDTSVYEAWRDGFFCYDNMPLSEVMEAIGRNYNMTVQFENREMMGTPIRFVCERRATVDEVVTLINSLKKAVVRRHDGVIVVE